MPLITSVSRLAPQPCGISLAWTSALLGGIALREEDLAPSMVLFFILLTFLVIGGLRVYQGRRMSSILIVFVPTLCFVVSLDVWSAVRADLSNRSHSSASLIQTYAGLTELVAANGLVGCAPMLLTETSHQIFGLLAKRLDPAARKWVRYTSYAARLMNLVALIMAVVATSDLASYTTAWLDQMRLVAVVADAAGLLCGTNTLGRDLTLLPLTASGIQVVVLSVLVILTICIRLRYRLAVGVVIHVICIQLCLALHYTWRCVRDWAALQLYLDGEWSHTSTSASIDPQGLQDLAHRLRREAENPTLFYLLGVVPLVLAMILVYTVNLASYTDPPATSAAPRPRTRFRLMLDPAAPKIELLPTKADASKDKDKAPGKGGKGKTDAKSNAETLVVKRGWLGRWSVKPAPQGPSWTSRATNHVKRRVRSWIMGWSSPPPTAS